MSRARFESNQPTAAPVRDPRRRRTRLLPAAAAGLVLLAASPALAQTQGQAEGQAQGQAAQPAEDGVDVERFQDWVLRCRDSEGQARSCVMIQNLVANKDGRRVLQVVIGRFGEQQVLGAIVSVPVGVRLPPGLTLRIDDREPLTYPYELCNPSSCQAQVRIDDALLQSLKAGLKGHVTFQDGAGRAATVTVSLKGFTAAFQALPGSGS